MTELPATLRASFGIGRASRAVRRWALVAAAGAMALAAADECAACFGARLRVGVPAEPRGALAAYALGYYIEEKTGIEPEFVEMKTNESAAAPTDRIDVVLSSASPRPSAFAVRAAGEVPGLGPAQVWLRKDVLEDLRFATVERALQKLSAFYGSAAYRGAERSVTTAPGEARKAARRAVLDAR